MIRIRSNQYDPIFAKEKKTGYHLIGFLETALEQNDDDVSKRLRFLAFKISDGDTTKSLRI